MAGIVHVPWYATVFRGDRFAAALSEVAPVTLRYGAGEYGVRRSHDDAYKFLLWAQFDDKLGFDAFWHGPEMVRFRMKHSGWYQVPVLYDWQDEIVYGAREPAAAEARALAPVDAEA